MKKTIIVLSAIAAVLLAAGCQQQYRDLENVPVQELENVRIYENVDGFANMVVGCIEGVAFVFTTRDFEAINRVPELDNEICGVDR